MENLNGTLSVLRQNFLDAIASVDGHARNFLNDRFAKAIKWLNAQLDAITEWLFDPSYYTDENTQKIINDSWTSLPRLQEEFTRLQEAITIQNAPLGNLQVTDLQGSWPTRPEVKTERQLQQRQAMEQAIAERRRFYGH